MTELLLNLVWVLVVGASLLIWRRSAHTSERQSPLVALVALICILVLLFPVISATDDLHFSEVAIEDSGRKVLRQALPDSSSNHFISHLAFAPPVLVLNVHPILEHVGFSGREQHLISKISYRAAVPDRAPPVLA